MLLVLALLAAVPPEAADFEVRTGLRVSCSSQCPTWTADALHDFDEALKALPEKLRRPKTPLELVLRRYDMPFAMGDGTLRRPDWSHDRAQFHVYGVAPTTERRAALRLQNLTEGQRASLWRRRALVHALLARAEDEHGLSKTKRWQRLSGWDSVLNVYDGAYSRLRGTQSAQLDLLTFGEEHFIPAESFGADALHIDDTIACQELSKSRVLSTLLYEKGLSEKPYRRPRCPAFDGWANVEHLESIEVLLVASSGRKPESLFGHLMMRPTHREGEFVKGPTFQSAVQIAAITDGAQKGPVYLAKGIFGGYRTAIFTLSMRDFERETLEDEQRVIRRFRLNLTAEENERVLERVWDLERRGYYDYKFFTDNCATTLARMVESAIDEDVTIEMPGAVLAAPSSALDGFGRVTRMRDGQRQSLLRRIGADIEPSSLVAERALATRQDAERRWLEQRAELKPWFDQLSDDNPHIRERAYVELAKAHAHSDADRAAQFDFWLASVRIERYAVDRARKALLELSIETLAESLVSRPTEDQLTERQKLFERESNLARHFAEIDRADAARERIAALPHRVLTEDERAQKQAHEATLQLFRTLTELHGDVVSRDHSPASVQTALQNEQRDAELTEQTWEKTALISSGSWRLAAGAAYDSRGIGGFRLHSAALSERLGDQRVRGFQPSTELHFLDGDTTFVFDGLQLPTVLSSDLVVFGWRSLGRVAPELRTSLKESFGYGLSIATDHRQYRVLEDRVRFDFETFAVLDKSKTFDRHLAFGIGPRALVAFGEPGVAAMIGPRAVVVQRTPLFGHAANALRFEASAAPLWAAGAQRGLTHEATAALELDLRLVIGRGVMLLRPRVGFEADATRRVATASLLIEPAEWRL